MELYIVGAIVAVLLLIILVCSVLAGAVWGMIPALFHAKYKTNQENVEQAYKRHIAITSMKPAENQSLCN